MTLVPEAKALERQIEKDLEKAKMDCEQDRKFAFYFQALPDQLLVDCEVKKRPKFILERDSASDIKHPFDCIAGNDLHPGFNLDGLFRLIRECYEVDKRLHNGGSDYKLDLKPFISSSSSVATGNPGPTGGVTGGPSGATTRVTLLTDGNTINLQSNSNNLVVNNLSNLNGVITPGVQNLEGGGVSNSNSNTTVTRLGGGPLNVPGNTTTCVGSSSTTLNQSQVLNLDTTTTSSLQQPVTLSILNRPIPIQAAFDPNSPDFLSKNLTDQSGNQLSPGLSTLVKLAHLSLGPEVQGGLLTYKKLDAREREVLGLEDFRREFVVKNRRKTF